MQTFPEDQRVTIYADTPPNYRIVDQDPASDELIFVSSFAAANDEVAMAEVERWGRTARDNLQIYDCGKWQWFTDPRHSAYVND